MIKQYGFYMNSSACAGCKACQVACKDKHNLDEGILWRRVYEVTGGDWKQDGAAWISNVFAYNVSMSCNHCDAPVCVSVCPTGAHHKKKNGIVSIDRKKCIGCRACEWACPYGAPQYDTQKGRMTKCSFCGDYLKDGQPPACVAACPMRGLDYGELEDLRRKYGRVDAVYPLPPPDMTRPSVVIGPHKDAARAAKEKAEVSNEEEV